MKEHLPSLSAAGNAAALVIVALVAAVLSRSFDPGPHAGVSAARLKADGPRARTLVLVVIDGLRADAAADPRLMPFTHGMARRGGSTTARVEALVPSTIAGVTTLATGDVPHPAAFLRDFRSPPAERGGLFEALALRGERSFVTGPSLWSDLFSRWTDTPHVAPPLGGSDEPVLRAGLAALSDPAYRLAVFHFGATDEAAHIYGAKSPEYARAVTWCDDAVRQISDRLGHDAAIVVTSDHGVTDRGGHAGPEPAVLTTPVAWFGPGLPRGEIPPLRQRDVPALVAAVLGIELSPAEPATPERFSRTAAPPALAAAALLTAIRLWSALAGGSGGRPHAFWLNLTVWVALLLLALGQSAAAALLCVAALLARAVILARTGPAFTAAPLVGLGVGASWALLRIASEWRGGASALPPAGAGMPLAVAFGFAVAVPLGMWLRRAGGSTRQMSRTGLCAGVTLATAAAPAYALAGQSLSLSSIDVSAAYHAAVHGGGLVAAVGLVILLQALPPLALVSGCVLPLRGVTPGAAGAYFVGISAVPVGEAVAAAVVLLVADDVPLNALALGCLLRAAATLVFLTCGAAVVVLAGAGLARRTGGEPPPAAVT